MRSMDRQLKLREIIEALYCPNSFAGRILYMPTGYSVGATHGYDYFLVLGAAAPRLNSKRQKNLYEHLCQSIRVEEDSSSVLKMCQELFNSVLEVPEGIILLLDQNNAEVQQFLADRQMLASQAAAATPVTGLLARASRWFGSSSANPSAAAAADMPSHRPG
jgi:hypothetical protein